ncbi:ribosome modulation factor [uncultured Porticoccus sp.]|uniref:ribosome modulation factor n=1 Tax=uncultured Porticoccus sp. TaxID=1256050 RepID=UPI0030DC440C|tara:strand:+ start:3506 stop:3712 length:207 start_codon:yes stop_codon:yes gene_type:complete
MKRQKRDSSHRAFIKGYQAGYHGRNKTLCPHAEETTLAQDWCNGWREGREDNWNGYKEQAIQQKVSNL